MKKILSILLTLAMVLSLVPAVFAADEPTITMSADKTSVAPGETVTLTLSLDKDTVVDGAGFKIDFDKEAYEYVKKVPDTFDDTTNENVANEKGWVRAVYLNTKPSKPTTWSAGKLDTFTFKAKEGANTSAATFKLTIENLEKYNPDDPAHNIKVAHKVVGSELTIPVETPAAKGYTVSLGADKQVASGQIVEIPVAIGNNDGKTTYSAYDMTFSFEPAILTLNMKATSIEGYRVIPGNGTVRIVRYGKAAELGDALTLSFVAAGQGKSDVKVTKACVDTNANAIEFDAPAAAILDDTAVITVSGYTVTLPDDFTRTDATGSVIEAGGNLTFVPKDPNYDYTVTVTVGGGEATTVSPDENGIYTVANVNGNVEVTSTKTPKTFTVAQGEDTTGAATATYQTDYTFKLTPVDGYVYKMAVTIGDKAYTGFKAQVNDDGTTTYTIPGADITGEIVINSNKQVKPLETYKVTFAGTGAGDATGESTVQEKANYTFTVAKQKNFEYTITATMGGKNVTITEGADNTYTIASVTGDLVITIEKKSTLTMEVAVSEYVQMDNKTVFLVTVTGTPEEGKAFAYGDNVMYKTTAYGENVYSWLVIVDKNEAFTVATAEANITKASATAEEVKQSYDVNETGVVDINDAQLTYDIYSGKYTDFEKVSVRKFLRADVTLDKAVNSTDAVAVVKNSK
ncbi:MAG: cohesin domain-containing protein [Oscillospiraceae bacterium]|nr:cohesin domain-containing protein [Oscillospiraceae bacterium]